MKNIRNPRIVSDSNMKAKQKVTWDCVWFGSYPQSEVERGSVVYNRLETTNGWDGNNDIIINGTKYRRMKKEDATYSTNSPEYYNWSDSTTYHYFKYEPIKWRVLSVSEKNGAKTALILADIALDNQQYNTDVTAISWEKSTIRSWLNGYGWESNTDGIDYSNRSFIDSAFNFNQKKVIVQSTISNADNLDYDTEGRADTEDQVFLLSESEVYGEQAAAYGFVEDYNIEDEARMCKSSTYAKAMGIWGDISYEYANNCDWWLRTPGDEQYASYVYMSGREGCCGQVTNTVDVGIRPALYLDLSCSDQYIYAGTVCSDGTVNEEKSNQTPVKQEMNNLSDERKIIIKVTRKNEHELERFENLRVGESFIYNGELFLKTHALRDSKIFNACSFENSQVYSIDACVLVNPVDLEFYYQEKNSAR